LRRSGRAKKDIFYADRAESDEDFKEEQAEDEEAPKKPLKRSRSSSTPSPRKPTPKKGKAEDKSEFYRENGYLVVNDVLSKEELDKMKEEILNICKGKYGKINGLQEIQEGESDDNIIKKYLAFHFPHKMSAHFKELMSHPNIVKVLNELIGPNVKSMQSMFFVKAAGKPGQAWHQDEWYIPTRDRSLTAVWIAVDDATIENGCLWVIPGSHKPGVLYPQKQHNDPKFDSAGESYNFPHKDEEAVPVEIKAGSVVIFNGYLLHRSLPNTAQSGFRRALANHYMSAESLLPWRWDERLKNVTDDNRDIVIVSGTDPYDYKGVENLTYPYIRSDKPVEGKTFNEV